jgi:hypothetical protein
MNDPAALPLWTRYALELLLPFALALAILGTALQLFLCYTIQVVADKVGLTRTWLAWIPLLQIVPLVRSGDGSLVQFGVLGLSLAALGLAAVLLSGLLPAAVGVLFLLGWALWASVVFSRLLWSIAVNREVSGWWGLLVGIPGIGLLAWLYIAFHDGLARPSRLGLALGLAFHGLPLLPLLRGEPDLAAWVEAAGAPPSAAAALAPGVAMPVPDPEAGFPVSDTFVCPAGTSERGAAPPAGFERWCERALPGEPPVRHGPYRAWYESGRPREHGSYGEGLREGVWTRWYPSGGKRAQAQFEAGVQHGLLLTWDEIGRKQRELRFRGGEPLSSPAGRAAAPIPPRG